MKPSYAFAALILPFGGCVAVREPGAWTAEDFRRASKPEVEDLAAACLRRCFDRPTSEPKRIIQIMIQDADWRVVVAKASLPPSQRILRGTQEVFWSKTEGYRDIATGLPVLMMGIDVASIKADRAEVYVGFSHGTGDGSSDDLYRLEKKNGHWVVIEIVQQRAS